MAFVPVPNTIEVDVNYLLDGQVVQNTMYFENTEPWTIAEIGIFLDGLNSIITEELMPLLSSSIQLFELVARLLDTASSIGFTFSLPTPVSGGRADEMLPSNVTYTISFRTGLTGRSFRGRNYIPGLSVDSVDNNTIDADTRTGLLAYYSAVKAYASEYGAPMVVVSRYSGIDADGDPIPRVTGVTTPIVSFGTADTTVDSQRRRLPGRGA